MAKKKTPKKEPDSADLWSIIERVEKVSGGERSAACEAFRAELDALDDEGLVGVEVQFDDAMARAYDWRLWAAAYVIHGGCSDDTFWDFRAGLVALGRDIYERALRDPDSLVEVEEVEERTLFEGFQYLPGKVREGSANGANLLPKATEATKAEQPWLIFVHFVCFGLKSNFNRLSSLTCPP